MPKFFSCAIPDDALVRACAPTQPSEIIVGQNWMRLNGDTTLPVKRVRDGRVDLGGLSITIVLTPKMLRDGWVCIDPPDNVHVLGGR